MKQLVEDSKLSPPGEKLIRGYPSSIIIAEAVLRGFNSKETQDSKLSPLDEKLIRGYPSSIIIAEAVLRGQSKKTKN